MENLSGINAKFIRGSVTDLSLLKSAFEDVDCVFHLAAIASVHKSVEGHEDRYNSKPTFF